MLRRLDTPVSPAQRDYAAPLVQSAERVLSLTLTLLFAVIIGTFFVSAGGLWRDEANSVTLVSLPSVSQIVRHLDGDSFPLLWLLLLRAWTNLARADIAVRALGLLTALGIPAALWFGAKESRVGFPFWSFLLLGLNPVFVRVIGATRAYGLGVLLVLLSAMLLWRACRRLTWQAGAAAFVVSLLCVQCLYYAVIFVGALCLGGLAVSWRRGASRAVLFFAGTFVASGASLLPYLPTIKRQHDWSVLIAIPVGSGNLWHVLSQALGAGGGFMVFVWVAVTAFGIGVGVYRQRNRAQSPLALQEAERALYALVGLGAGALGYWVFLLALKYPTSPWYYAVPMAQSVFCLDLLLGGALPSRWRVARAGVCFVLLGLTFGPARSGAQVRQTGLDLAAARVEAQARPRDFVLVNPWYDGATWARYYHGVAPWQAVPLPAYRGYGGMDQVKHQMSLSQPLTPLFAQMTHILRGGGRVWLVGDLPCARLGVLPAPLPPAPLPASGWKSGPYTANWGRQVQAFLLTHAAQTQTEEVTAPQPINSLEAPQIETCQGWREASPGHSIRIP